MIDFLEALRSGSNTPPNGYIEFLSTSHTREDVRGLHPASICKRCVKIERNISGNRGYTVSILNLEGNHPLWGSNVQMSAKPMEVVHFEHNVVVLRGYGHDENALSLGVPLSAATFTSYGLGIVFSEEGSILSCTLLLHDKGAIIQYV